jgi:hypothetical protein
MRQAVVRLVHDLVDGDRPDFFIGIGGLEGGQLCRSVSQVSSSSAGRAFRAGKEPTMPALHCAATSAGPLAMNIGEAMTGRERFCNAAGRAMADSLES